MSFDNKNLPLVKSLNNIMDTYAFTWQELQPLIEWIARGPLPDEKDRPGITHIINRLEVIRRENDSERIRSKKENDRVHDEFRFWE